MREILFRGKRLNGDGWAYGDLSYHAHNGEVYVFPRYGYDSPDCYEVDPATVGQYTGLTDKSGVKIFEGDIVLVCLNPEIRAGIVEFDERVGAFIVKLSGNKCSPFLDLYVARNKDPGLIWTEVIGNIHDNPELLKEG